MSFLKKAVDTLDPKEDTKTELGLALGLLSELASQKQDLQKALLKQDLRTAGQKDNGENFSIPVTNTLAWHTETRAYVDKNAANLGTVVTKAVKAFIDGGSDKIMEGIGGLLTGSLNAILGSGTASEAEKQLYYILIDGLAIIRFDVLVWRRRVEATGITKEIQDVLAFTLAKSSVDVDKISFNTFLSAYQPQLANMHFNPEEVKERITEAKEIYDLLRSSNTNLRDSDRIPSHAKLIMPGEAINIDTRNFLRNI